MLVVGGAAPAQAQGQAAYSFVANTGADSVTEYAMGASGNETPVATITGSATGLDGPEGVAVDSAGHLFVANINVDSVTEYAKGATGNTAPVATISGSATGLSRPVGVAVDSAGHLFVTNFGAESVTEYAQGATGNARWRPSPGPIPSQQPHWRGGGLRWAPVRGQPRRRSGTRRQATGNAPVALTGGHRAHLFVTNTSADSVTEYAQGATGNATPVATIPGRPPGSASPRAWR